MRSRPRRWYRLVLLALVASALVVGVLLTNRGGEAPAEAAPGGVPPGVDARVQAWLKSREKLQIELNNALVPIALKKVTTVGAAKAPCQRVKKAAHAMVVQEKAPHAEVDALARAGLEKIEQGADACLAGDLAAAQRLVAEGLAERTAASLPLDETLEGE